MIKKKKYLKYSKWDFSIVYKGDSTVNILDNVAEELIKIKCVSPSKCKICIGAEIIVKFNFQSRNVSTKHYILSDSFNAIGEFKGKIESYNLDRKQGYVNYLFVRVYGEMVDTELVKSCFYRYFHPNGENIEKDYINNILQSIEIIDKSEDMIVKNDDCYEELKYIRSIKSKLKGNNRLVDRVLNIQKEAHRVKIIDLLIEIKCNKVTGKEMNKLKNSLNYYKKMYKFVWNISRRVIKVVVNNTEFDIWKSNKRRFSRLIK